MYLRVKNLFYLSALILLVAVFSGYYRQYRSQKLTNEIAQWGENNKIVIKKSEAQLKAFKVEFNETEWNTLLRKLELSRYFKPLDNKIVPKFEYGFDPEYTRELVKHWKTKFSWKSQVDVLNKFPQFQISINDTIIHYVHFKTNAKSNLKSIPVVLVDGWPGSFYGFYQMIDFIDENYAGYSLDIVVPSIPGYHFSTPLNKPIDAIDTAILFDGLMRFLHGENCFYYAHGEDWGAIVTTFMARLYPNRLKGLHLTMPASHDRTDFFAGIYSILGPLFPSLFFTDKEIENGLTKRFTLQNRAMIMFKDLGYMHLQATKPDSIGHGLTDSPVGLLAYILEKYSSWSFNFDKQISGTADGSLNKFNQDDLLTIATLYWMSNSITSSIRFYKCFFNAIASDHWPKNVIMNSVVSARVPVAYQFNLNEIFFQPRKMVEFIYPNLRQYEIHMDGGHFAAFQNPKYTAQDLLSFIDDIIDD